MNHKEILFTVSWLEDDPEFPQNGVFSKNGRTLRFTGASRRVIREFAVSYEDIACSFQETYGTTAHSADYDFSSFIREYFASLLAFIVPEEIPFQIRQITGMKDTWDNIEQEYPMNL